MATRYDSIIIGGGHNGLAAAAYLAKAGRKVLVLERRHVLGGAAVSEEVFPGFTYSVCSYVVSLLRPEIIRELDLPRHGLEILPLECSFSPAVEGPGLVRWPDHDRTRSEIARYSKRDADRYPEFGLAMAKLARFVKPLIDREAPDPTSLKPTELYRLFETAQPFRALGPHGLHRMVKMMTMSAVDFLREWFEADALIAPMSVSGIIGTYLGVRSPGTAYVLLHHYMGEIDGVARAWGLSRGGTGQISLSIARAAESYGAEIRTSAGVSKVNMREGEAVGVVLEDGTELSASTVVSSVDPRLTFFGFVGKDKLPDEFVRDLGRYRLRGSSGKVNLALDRLPTFKCRPGDGLHVRGDISVGPSVDYLERAYDEAKYGAWSKRPYINVVIPSLTDPTVAPPGKHVMSCFVQYAPYHLKEGTWPEQREAWGDTVVATLEEVAPGIRDSILHRQVLTPWDLEKEFGLTEGNIFHGELSLEQLAFLRPVPRWSRYKTPIPRLWMCGSGTHPGGGVMGAPGRLAALRMLKERAV
ncbi:MAG TPA: NAD(P)/FAD-dependent oxidoreductase [Polyangiaceae bacterium]|jgi:phytoene dehydrogenase-like protein|nr:NAD(P)/FAD-dependent oxidoreductase [Polyangiaceae bacterium]